MVTSGHGELYAIPRKPLSLDPGISLRTHLAVGLGEVLGTVRFQGELSAEQEGESCQPLRQLVALVPYRVESLTCSLNCTRLLIQAQFLLFNPQMSPKKQKILFLSPWRPGRVAVLVSLVFIQPRQLTFWVLLLTL